ncbi:DUF6587 family protein [Silanimonas sp.]|jgi:hypothetical protein|uniref:DUF6587 family protein n=1 Tax=Silanimonas sp. TaxID=1929290 RepID=UPI0037C707EE
MLQEFIVALLVLAAAAFVVHDRAPGLSRRLRVALVREGRPAWMKRAGRWIAPPRVASNGCGGCTGCEPTR